MRTLLKSGWLYERRADAASLACITLFFVAFFPQGLFGGKYLLAGDAFAYSYPLRTVAWRMIRAGELPLWTPYLMSGYPLLSMAQIGLGYPLTWGYLFVPGYIAEQIYVLAPFLFAPAFTYAYLRELRRSSLASLMGALTFGYGGMMASRLANNGLMPNAVMWLPLLLLALERARRRRFVPCLLLGTFAYTMSVLTGVGQGFLYVGVLAAAYALWLVFTSPGEPARGKFDVRFASVRAWRPVLLGCGAGLLATGVAAFQILETARAVRRSVRSALSYEIFTQGSFTPVLLWKSFVAPLFHVIDMTAYVPPLAVALALGAAYAHARGTTARDSRVFFWLIIALLACVLMMGQYTPLYRVFYHLPLLNRFRVPSRHTFEWTFAIGVLAAYGWDACASVLRRRRETRVHAFRLYAALALVAASIVTGALWWWQALAMNAGGTETTGALQPVTVYLLWKLAFVSLMLTALWRVSLVAGARWRRGLLLACVLVLCYVESSVLVTRWWGGALALSASRFATPALTTAYLQQFPATENRVYTRVDLMSEEFGSPPIIDAPNLSAVWGLHNVAGYEPLILERYSRALGNVGLDTVHTVASGPPDRTLFTTHSHVLDILNTVFVVSYPNLTTAPAAAGASDSAADLETIGELAPQTSQTLSAPPTDAAALLFVTSLSNSTAEPDGKAVARVRAYTTDGRVIERELQAGRDTAEWAHERADVRAVVRHRLAPVFDSTQIDGAAGFTAYRYKAVLPLGEMARVNKVEIANVSQASHLGIYGAALLDAQRRVPLVVGYSMGWQPVYTQDPPLIMRNTRALPRAWLVAEAEAVDGEEALRRIRGESTHEFDPRLTALLEVNPDQLPQLPGGQLAAKSGAHITSYEPNRLEIETAAPTSTVLVVSEIFYPGWTATVDGKPAPISVADYLLRGVALPAGKHRVEMCYVAPAARKGAIISVLTLVLLCGLFIFARRQGASRAGVAADNPQPERDA